MSRRRALLMAFGLGFAASSSAGSVASARAVQATAVRAAPKSESVLAEDALRQGQYDRAIEAAQSDLRAAPQSFPALATLTRALTETGKYSEAEDTVRGFSTRNPKAADAQTLLGDVLVLRGKRADAEAAYQKSIAAKSPTSLSAEAGLGELLYDRGLQSDARIHFERLIAAYNSGRAKSAGDLIAVGRACRYLGVTNPQAFKDALKAFDEAAGSDDTEDARILTGQLFLEKFNGTEARASFESVLQANESSPRALLGLARARDFDGERGVPDLVDKALKTNPNFVEGLAFKSTMLLALEDAAGARAQAERALEINASSVEALSALAAAQYVGGDTTAFEVTRQKAAALFPKSGELLVSVAEAAVRNRLYSQSADLARAALEKDAQSWSALAALGQNQLRLGDIDEARKSLTKSFEGDPYNVWVKNTLDLLDTFANYTTIDSDRFHLFLDKKEAGLLAPPMGALAGEAMDKLTSRYGFTPKGAIRIEAYPSHADFSVRTVGLAGLGALGVCFGPVVAIDSPQARDRGVFNWGSTLWHELAHVVTLGASANRVPRWLTEGLSVYEERRARPGWGDDLSLEFLMAYQAGEILPLRELNNGFVRPKRPEQVSLSYYQASLVAEEIEKRHGIAGLRGLLAAYAQGKTTDEAFTTVLGKSVDAFDAEFQAALKQRLEKPLAGIPKAPRAEPGKQDGPRGDSTRAILEARLSRNQNDFAAHVGLGLLLHREKRDDDALTHLERAASIWPEATGDETPYVAIAEIKKARGDVDGAIAALKSLVALNETTDSARSELASLLESRGRVDEALDVLEGMVFIYPLDAKLHERRAALAARAHKPEIVRAARRAIVELDPVDKAEAYYQLALADLDAGDRAAARKNVLQSLEIAPRFGRAQELLLQIHRGESKS